MRKVVINGDYLAFATFAGVSRFATELVYELDNMVDGQGIELVCPSYTKNIPILRNIKIVWHGEEQIDRWKHISLPKYIKKENAILVDLTQAFPLSVRSITCVHDCIPELVDTAYSGLKGKWIKRPVKLLQRRIILRRSCHILTVSEFSKKDLMRIYKLPTNKITVVNNAWQHITKIDYDDSIIDKNAVLSDRDFYFTLGSRVPHKNLEWIVAAAKANPGDQFVVSGENKYCLGFENKTFPKNILFTGYISDGEIRSLMRKCEAFILPSFYEGFGIPPLEALAEGAEIIISNASCLPEIYGNSAHYIDPNDYENVNLDEILSCPVENSSKTLEKYSWKKSAETLYKVICKNRNS